MRRKKTLPKKKIDKQLFYLIIIFVVIGLIFVADVSAPQALTYFGDKYLFFKKQSLYVLIGAVSLFITYSIPYLFWKKISLIIFFISILLLIIVLFPGFSYSALGARRWIVIAGINFQPSEASKLAIAMLLARFISDNKNYLYYYIPILITVFLIMLQPDLGTTSILLIITLGQIFNSSIGIKKFISSIFVGIIGFMGLILISPYRRDRLMTLFESTSDPLGKGYHIRQILLGLGSGGLFGVGLGQSRQKYLFLPEAATDSIFAAISEEIGFVGSVFIIFAFLYFVFRGLKIAANAPDEFSKILAIGITLWIGGQAIINFTSMVALTPLTGVPLPFFSSGGTSLIIVLAGCGILLNISKYATEKNINGRKPRCNYGTCGYKRN